MFKRMASLAMVLLLGVVLHGCSETLRTVTANLGDATASLQKGRGAYAEAELSYRQSLSIREEALGPDHPDVAISLNNLGELYREQGRYQDAEPIFQRAIRIREKALGPDHPDTIISRNNLAEIRQVLGESTGSAKDHKPGRATSPSGQDATASYIQEMARRLVALARSGRYEEAEGIAQALIAAYEERSGPDHIETVRFMDILGGLYMKQGKYDQAASIFRRSLAIKAKTLGSDHPDTIISRNNLAELDKARGGSKGAAVDAKPKRAEALPGKNATASDIERLNRQYKAADREGNYQEAEAPAGALLAIYEERLGPNHYETNYIRSRLGSIYNAQEKYRQTVQLMQRSIAIKETSLGPDHPGIVYELERLAHLYVYNDQGSTGQAEQLLQRSVSIHEKARTLGPNHPDTARSLYTLAKFYIKQGKHEQAEQPLQRSLSIREKIFGAAAEDAIDTNTIRNALVLSYEKQGKYDQAERVLRGDKGAADSERAEDAPGQDATAHRPEVAMQRSLAIREQVHGLVTADIVDARYKLVSLYVEQGKYEQAERLLQRNIRIHEEAAGFGPGSASAHSARSSLVRFYQERGKDEQAEKLMQHGLVIYNKLIGPDHPSTVTSRNNLVQFYQQRGKDEQAQSVREQTQIAREAWQRAQAEPISEQEIVARLRKGQASLDKGTYPTNLEDDFKEILALAKQRLGPDHPVTAKAYGILGFIYKHVGQYEDAELFLRRALAIQEKTQPDHPGTAETLRRLGEMYRNQENYVIAKPFLQRALAISEKALGPDHPDSVKARGSLAALQRLAGGVNASRLGTESLSDAERNKATIEAATQMAEERGGGSGIGMTDDLSGLAISSARLFELGNYIDAEPIILQAIARVESTVGVHHPMAPALMLMLARIYAEQGRHTEVGRLYERVYEIFSRLVGPNHSIYIGIDYYSAENYAEQGRYDEAQLRYERLLLAVKNTAGAAGLDASAYEIFEYDPAEIELRLAGVYTKQGQYDKARPLFQRALPIVEKLEIEGKYAVEESISGGLRTAQGLRDWAEFYSKQGQHARAEPLLQRCLSIVEKIFRGQHSRTARFFHSLAVLYDDQGRTDKALDLMQRAMQVYAGRNGSGRSARLEQRAAKEHYLFYLSLLIKKSGATMTQAADVGVAAPILQLARASDVAAALNQMTARFAASDTALARFARQHQDNGAQLEQAELTARRNLLKTAKQCDLTCRGDARQQVARWKAELAKTEEVLRRDFPDYAELTDPQPLTLEQIQALLRPKEVLLAHVFGKQSGYALAVTQTRAELHPIKLTASQMHDMVTRLRMDVDPTVWGETIPDFDAPLAARLYDLLIRPIESMLVQGGHLILVPDAVTTSLPPQLLLTEPQSSSVESNAHQTFAALPWLVRRVSFSIVPAISSFAALRKTARASDAKLPFLGIGDPVYHDGASRAKQEPTTLQPLESERDDTVSSPTRRASFAKLALLPESADELKQIATYLGPDDSTLLLGKAAREKRIRNTSMRDYRVIAFATHGLLVEETERLFGLSEPALAFTPAQTAEGGDVAEEDDGLLTASEIAKLILNADWVILSACNTASAGEDDPQGLSGLAKAFFYAGARTLFVTHWSVFSEAAKQMTVGTLRNAQKKGVARAQAHRMTMLEMLKGGGKFSHPAAWAPFAVVGDGGVMLRG